MDEPIRILVVDDVRQNLVAIAALLERPGLRVLQARSGTEALEALLAEDVALALVDVQMPNMDGFELAELIRGTERTRRTPIIFLTASASDPGRTFRGYEAGAVDFLHKPIDPQVLRGKVDVFVQLHAQRLELARQLGQLQQALRTNELFAAVLGHDLRNPLGAILNGAELVARLAGDDDKLAKVARLMRSSGERMARMIEQLLDVARIRAGRLEMQPREADLGELARHVVEELQRHGKGARVVLGIRGDARGRFDPDRLGAAISNLVANALQHGRESSPVRVTVDGEGEALGVEVANDGVVPPATLESMFEPFHARRPGGGNAGGLGLGLYIVHEFVRAHGGTLEASSSEEAGTTIRLRVPRGMAASPRALHD